MISRLLFFEGPPGGGKSSLSEFVAQQLQAASIPVHWIEEHTLDSTLFASFFEALDTAPAEAARTLLADWCQVVDRLYASQEVWCLDGAFFHSTLKLLLAYDYDQVQIAHYLQALYDLLTPLAPTLIHLTGNVDAIMRVTFAERGDLWAKNVADEVAQYPCQQRLHLSGVEGLVGFFVDSQRQLEAIATTYPFEVYRLDTTAREWERYQQAVCAWLEIPVVTVYRAPSCDFAQYAGTYQPPAFFPPAFNHPLQVEHIPEGLRLHMVFMRNFRLVERETDCFSIAGRPLKVEFIRDAQGRLQGMIYPFVPEQRFFCEKVNQEAFR